MHTQVNDGILFSHKKEQERMTRVTVWVHLEDTALSEISQTGKGEYCMASFLCSKKKKNQTHRNRE